MLRNKRLKPKKCQVKTCRAEYIPDRSFQTWCSIPCAVILAGDRLARKAKAEEKRARADFRVRKLAAKKISYWTNRTQRAVNALRRAIDANQPCYTCGTWETVQREAGHYRSRGACSSARFDWKRNLRTCCHHCNVHLSGNLGRFRVALAAEIGEAEVLALEAMPKSYRWTREECEAIEAEANAQRKGLLAMAA